MKKKFSKKWKASKKPRKQRKYRANALLHIRKKMLNANLSKELRKKHAQRSFALRKGDSVKITRGEFKAKKGKIALVNLKKLKVAVEGIQRTKKDGTKINVLFDPSNLQIQELNLDDKMRMKSIKGKKEEKEKKAENKEAKKEQGEKKREKEQEQEEKKREENKEAKRENAP